MNENELLAVCPSCMHVSSQCSCIYPVQYCEVNLMLFHSIFGYRYLELYEWLSTRISDVKIGTRIGAF